MVSTVLAAVVIALKCLNNQMVDSIAMHEEKIVMAVDVDGLVLVQDLIVEVPVLALIFFNHQ